jgi:hypothetical protein
MPVTLTEREQGFNEGLDVAIEYHEKRARSADKASSALAPDERDGAMYRLALRCVQTMMDHRGHGNALRKLRKRAP